MANFITVTFNAQITLTTEGTMSLSILILGALAYTEHIILPCRRRPQSFSVELKVIEIRVGLS